MFKYCVFEMFEGQVLGIRDVDWKTIVPHFH